VLEACGISNGDEMPYYQFISTVKAKVIDTGLRNVICGDCGWNYICEQSNRA
jgi:hypothetical protein